MSIAPRAEPQPVTSGGPEVPPLPDERRPVLIILHQEHSNPGRVGQWFTANGFPLDIRRPRFGDSLPHTMAQHAGAVIFGGPMSANDPDDYIQRETDWIGIPLKEQQPFFGICLGAQMLARHLGATVATHPEGEVEIGYVPVAAQGPERDALPWPDRFYQWHREGFEIPHGAQRMAHAGGPFENQAFRYGPAAVGVQFHPEITMAMVSRWTGHNPHRLTMPGAQSREAQLEHHIRHAPAVHRWLDTFLRTWLASGAETRVGRRAA